ncbi:hypothetical protein OXPF_27930 [Oxobacter pfennigii]|uniref:Uncharacterized protein n=1 Tax=Oxobacter pfennigii TaxID=36849 RepID=A0A0N8NSY8_9CLOT|nr:hypothetical protein OXPF_27930 [Oxobacter pfennigii]
MHFKKIRTIFLLCFAFSLAFNIKAHAGVLNIEAVGALNGKGKLGHVSPIVVTVEADGEGIEGSLTLSIGEDTYNHNINITPGTEKAYTFLMPVKNPVKDFKVSVTEKDKATEEKTFPITIYESNYPFIGVLSGNADNYRFFTELKIDPLETAGAEVIDLKNVEPSYQMFQNINFIILDDFNTESLSQNFMENLDKWLKNGGILFLGKGKYEYKNFQGPFENIKDITYIGNGLIVPVVFELSERNSINEFQKILLENMNYKTLSSLTEKANIKETVQNIEMLNSPAHSILKADRNLIYFLVCLLILYGACVTAMVFLKKSRAYMWAGVIVLFTAVTYTVYFMEGSGGQKVTMASANEFFNGYYKANSLINIYPSKKDITFTNTGSLMVPAQGGGEYIHDAVEGSITYKTTGVTNYIYNFAVNSMEGDTGFQLTLEDGHIKGEIKNQLLYELKDSFLIIGDTFIKIGDIESNERVEIDYLLDEGLGGKGDFEYIDTIQKELSDKYEKEFIKYYITLKNSGEYNCQLVGFSKRNTALNINGKPLRAGSMNMEIIPVTLKSSGNMEIPGGVIKPSLKYELQNGNIREYTFRNGEAVKIYYNLPKGIQMSEIIIDSFAGFTIEAFNGGLNIWEAVEGGVISNREFLDNNNILALRIKGEGRLILPGIKIRGVIK